MIYKQQKKILKDFNDKSKQREDNNSKIGFQIIEKYPKEIQQQDDFQKKYEL